MGMYDTIHLVGAQAERVTCAAGHPMRDGLQTKDLDCNLDSYKVFEGRLFVDRRGERASSVVTAIRVVGGKLVTSTEDAAESINLNGEVEAYAHCSDCDPVVFEGAHDQTWGEGRLRTVQPWVEWALVFRDGVLVETRPVRNETRDQLRVKPIEPALPDDDRVARRTIEQFRQQHPIGK